MEMGYRLSPNKSFQRASAQQGREWAALITHPVGSTKDIQDIFVLNTFTVEIYRSIKIS